MSATVTMRIWRGDSVGGAFHDYEVAVEEGEVVLDALHRVQATQAGDLALRWNCKAGRCGSCSAEINGYPRLMCMTRLNQLPEGEPVSVAPLGAFPTIRDLVSQRLPGLHQRCQLLPGGSARASRSMNRTGAP